VHRRVYIGTQKTRTAYGKVYRYWQLRWFGLDERLYSESIGRMDKVSRRQVEKRRMAKEMELFGSPGKLTPSRVPILADFCKAYIEARKSEVAPGTIELHEMTNRYLKAQLGEERRIDTITRFDARAFKTALAKGDLVRVNERKHGPPTAATVDLHIRNARTMFNRAVDDDLIQFNPFDRLAGGVAPTEKNWHYVDAAEFKKLLGACPNDGWRVFLGLCRLAGLRQGEALSLRWGQVDWDGNRLEVWGEKTKRKRVVPVAPELLPILRAAFEKAAEGEVYVVTGVTHLNVWRDFGVICKHAGVKQYAKWCHTLRKNREGDWISAGFPFHVVADWMGHSPEVARQHYLRVDDNNMAAASSRPISEIWAQLYAPVDPAKTVLTQLLTQLDRSEDKSEREVASQDQESEEVEEKAGDGIRTHDVQLGKLAFYH
jgi:integrase